MLIEFTVVKLGWTFSFNFDQLAAGVIWAIGVSMVVLAALVYLPRVALVVSIAPIAGHNLLDGIRAAVGWVWYFLHNQVSCVAAIAPLCLSSTLSSPGLA